MNWFWTAFIIISVGDENRQDYEPLQSFDTRLECEIFKSTYDLNEIKSQDQSIRITCVKTDEKPILLDRSTKYQK